MFFSRSSKALFAFIVFGLVCGWAHSYDDCLSEVQHKVLKGYILYQMKRNPSDVLNDLRKAVIAKNLDQDCLPKTSELLSTVMIMIDEYPDLAKVYKKRPEFCLVVAVLYVLDPNGVRLAKILREKGVGARKCRKKQGAVKALLSGVALAGLGAFALYAVSRIYSRSQWSEPVGQQAEPSNPLVELEGDN